MKTLQVTSKRKASAMILDSLFAPVNGRTLSRERYYTGKHAPDAFPVGYEMEVPEDVHALWTEKGKDSHGAFCRLFCLVSR